MNEDDLRASLAERVVAALPMAVVVLDAAGRVRWASDGVEGFLGVAAADLVGRDAALLEREELAALWEPDEWIALSPGGKPTLFHRFERVGEEGERILFLQPVPELVELQREVISLKEQIASLNLTDAETGLFSQRALNLILEPQVARSRRYDNPLSVIVMAVELAEGVEEGFRRVAQQLKEQLRWADLVGRDRWGRFVLILPETTRDAAAALAGKISRRLRESGLVSECRAGLAEWRKQDSASGLLQRAAESLLAEAAASGEAVSGT
ncbi:MAG TPA: diguanylate cyclase [Thiotrichales bacterium]|nr:diguanylate cyclase [Thiotrichales bacterium]